MTPISFQISRFGCTCKKKCVSWSRFNFSSLDSATLMLPPSGSASSRTILGNRQEDTRDCLHWGEFVEPTECKWSFSAHTTKFRNFTVLIQCAVPSQDACKHPWPGPAHRDGFTKPVLVRMNSQDFQCFMLVSSFQWERCQTTSWVQMKALM